MANKQYSEKTDNAVDTAETKPEELKPRPREAKLSEKKNKNDIERVIEVLSKEPRCFPPGIQKSAEIAAELGVEFKLVRQVINQITVGIFTLNV